MFNRSSDPDTARDMSLATHLESQEREEWEVKSLQYLSAENLKPKFLTGKRISLREVKPARKRIKPILIRPPSVELPLDVRSFSANSSRFLSQSNVRSESKLQILSERSEPRLTTKSAIKINLEIKVGHTIPNENLVSKSSSSLNMLSKLRRKLLTKHTQFKSAPETGRPTELQGKILNQRSKMPEILSREEVNDRIKSRPKLDENNLSKSILRSKASRHLALLGADKQDAGASLTTADKKSVRFSRKVFLCMYRKD